MKIQEMHVTPVAITDPPLRNAAGLHAPYALRVIIELVTNDGISGLGEMPGGADILADLEAVKPLVIAADPFQLNAIQQSIQNHYSFQPLQQLIKN